MLAFKTNKKLLSRRDAETLSFNSFNSDLCASAPLRETVFRFLSVALLLAALTATAAQEAEPIVVTAPPLVEGEYISVFGGSIAVVGREQMDNAGAQDLQAALRRLPGVGISRYSLLGAFGGADGGSIYIRGRGTGRPGSDIMVYQDGVPRVVGAWDHPLMDVVAVDHAERIAVYKGPQPAFNSGTFGSVDITSRRRLVPGRETEAEVSVGEHETLTGRLHHGGRSKDGFDYYAGASYRETDGHRPHSAARLESLYGRVGNSLNEVFALSAQVTVTDNRVEDPGVVGQPVPVRDEFATRTVTSAVRLDNRSKLLSGFVLVYHEDGQIRWDKDFINGPGTPPGASDTDWENYGFRIGQSLPLDTFNLHGSLEGSSEGGETENRTVSGMVPFAYDDRYETLVPGAAIDFLWVLDSGWKLQPSAGVRGYFHSEFDHEFAPHAGLRARNKNWTFFANAARGVNYPGVYASGIAASTLDQLEAEVLEHVEAGAQWHDRLVGVGVTAFRDRTDNLLQWTPQGLVNVGSANIDGIEVSVSMDPQPHLALYGSVTLLDAQDSKTPRAPEWSASAGASLAVTKRLQLHADVDAVASQYAFNGRDGQMARAAVEKVDRYVLGNLRVSYAVPVGEDLRLTLFAGCENVADVNYETLAGYPLPGRFYSGGARVTF
jgi:iron complex outermembrane receptor protein